VQLIHIAGASGTGKTTRLVELIRSAVDEGRSVGAIKHTHHPLNEENRGDTARFLAAGAKPVILAGNGEAVVFDGTSTRRVAYSEQADLLALLTNDLVVVEGFKKDA
jgi:molybdopterin-guanine dinucleotide biosynthesis protein B